MSKTKGIKFAKMHGLGNDFMVLDGINQQIDLQPAQIAALSQRNTGIGFDQCLLVQASQHAGIDFNYRIFNADGQEVGQCGNGARCLALFVTHYGLTTKKKLTVATKTTHMELHINADNSVSVNMGIPNSNPSDIPLIAEMQSSEYFLDIQNQENAAIHAISVGNPHAVLLVDDIQSAPVSTLGPQISLHPRFPEQTNTGFMQIINSQHIKLRVYERGCGETLACGSGAVAAAAIGRLYHGLDSQVKVSLPGGDLIIEWPHLNDSITLTGPATFVYEAVLLS
jgi:diaminopimelate epimerase